MSVIAAWRAAQPCAIEPTINQRNPAAALRGPGDDAPGLAGRIERASTRRSLGNKHRCSSIAVD